MKLNTKRKTTKQLKKEEYGIQMQGNHMTTRSSLTLDDINLKQKKKKTYNSINNNKNTPTNDESPRENCLIDGPKRCQYNKLNISSVCKSIKNMLLKLRNLNLRIRKDFLSFSVLWLSLAKPPTF